MAFFTEIERKSVDILCEEPAYSELKMAAHEVTSSTKPIFHVQPSGTATGYCCLAAAGVRPSLPCSPGGQPWLRNI